MAVALTAHVSKSLVVDEQFTVARGGGFYSMIHGPTRTFSEHSVFLQIVNGYVCTVHVS